MKVNTLIELIKLAPHPTVIPYASHVRTPLRDEGETGQQDIYCQIDLTL
jgi:hypothetical protein